MGLSANPRHQDRLGAEWLESNLAGKNPGRPEAQLDEHGQQCTLAAKRGNSVLGCTRQSITSRLREVILSLSSVLVRHLGCRVRFQDKEDMGILE